MGTEPRLFTAFLHCSSQWDGDLGTLAEARVPVRFSIGEGDEYYGPDSVRRAVEGLPQGILGSTRNMAADIALKIVGITLSATVFPPAMVCSVIFTLCCIVIPQQLRE